MIKVIATGSTGNSYLIEANPNERLLIECGIPYKRILEGLDYNISGIQGCLISHEHKDHCKAVDKIIESGINCYMSRGTKEGINFKTNILYRGKIVENLKVFNIGNFRITPFKAQHDTNEPFGYLIYHKEIGSIAFLTDSYYCRYVVNNVNHILIECNYLDEIVDDLPSYRKRVIKSHMSLNTCKETLKAWDLKETKDITLIHISGDNGNPERMQKEIQELTGKKVYIAKPNLIIKGKL